MMPTGGRVSWYNCLLEWFLLGFWMPPPKWALSHHAKWISMFVAKVLHSSYYSSWIKDLIHFYPLSLKFVPFCNILILISLFQSTQCAFSSENTQVIKKKFCIGKDIYTWFLALLVLITLGCNVSKIWTSQHCSLGHGSCLHFPLVLTFLFA